MGTGEASAALESSENRYQTLVDAIEDYAIYMLDPGGQVVTWNRGAARSNGYTSKEVLGRHFGMFFVPEDILAKVPEEELESATRSGRHAGEGWRLRKNGERFWASFVLSAIREESGQLTGFANVTRDMSEEKRHQDAMRVLELGIRDERNRLYGAAECSMDALFICQAQRGTSGEIDDFIFVFLNGNAEKMVNFPQSALQGGHMCELFPVTLTTGLLEQYKRVVITGEPLVREVLFKDETINALWLRIQVVKVGDGIAINASDITSRKQNEERILHLAQHDDLTGLPNRSLMCDRIGQAIERARRFGGRVAVFLVDLDCGHAVGDGVLVTVAVRLKAAVRATDSVIRMGGDEFVVVMPDITDQLDMTECATKILNALHSNIEVGGHSIRTTCSVGLAVYPDSAETVDQLLLRADTAMYVAKRNGKNQYSVAPQDGGHNPGESRSPQRLSRRLNRDTMKSRPIAVRHSRPKE
jgi:diguanylate cyclase (GGDEF)-like protein/PAS domain S-box-containing protein